MQKPPEKIVLLVGRFSASGSGEAKAIAEELVKMTDSFCKEFLNGEYAELCRKLATALA